MVGLQFCTQTFLRILQDGVQWQQTIGARMSRQSALTTGAGRRPKACLTLTHTQPAGTSSNTQPRRIRHAGTNMAFQLI